MVNGMAQRYLQNRVSHTQHHNPDNTLVTTYYSYDPHGNVEWMVQDIPLLGRKSISYEYDLISGNVTRVAYNKGKADQFYHRYSYDEDNRIKSVQTSDNGNLTTLMRQTTTGAVMDNLSYHYMTENGSPTNKLEYVNDDVSETTFTDDIDNQSSGNYRYDAIGNLVSDASENINQITWTATGKVSKIEKADGEATTFLYDAGGNRVEKLHTTTGGITTATYYVRDARGNIMATYKGTDVDAADGSTGKDRLITLSVIVNLLKSGHDLRLVQTFAGHKYPSATEKYRQTGIGELKAGIEKYYPLK
jgi:YD repeat-containing protein